MRYSASLKREIIVRILHRAAECGREERMKDLEDILKRTIEHLRSVSDSDAVVGKAIVTEDGTAVIPVSKVSYGFVAGGGEYGVSQESVKGNEYPCAAASGGGITVTPLGFLVCGKEKKFLPVSAAEKEDRLKELLRTAVKALKKDESDE